ncbi:HpcH/HpaI aldolase/citrate lyase family protein [Salipiger sp.]|uniref:HpcH/HpaI aldolase/citrate lyase family protein n=1 Tax=Salipiger sp. TaxID=2078585 RepID=UPI003A970047
MDGGGIRSLLFVPGDKEALIRKALASQADAVIVDLEDAVAPADKAGARRVTRDVLSEADRRGKPVLIRLNAFDTGMTAQDLAAVMPARPWGIVLPKAGGAADLERLAAFLEVLEAREEIAGGTTRIMTVATESAEATLNLARPHSGAGARVWGLLWGGEDLSASLGAMANRDESGGYTFPYQYARSQCLFAANAIGAVAVDAVHVDFRDSAGLEAETRAALRDGFGAKAAIHPAQAEIINRVMTPTENQLAWAREVVDLLQHAGVARLDGRMVDIAHKRIALRLLGRAAALAGRPAP